LKHRGDVGQGEFDQHLLKAPDKAARQQQANGGGIQV
jgi:hypothetical protein